jgi:hypothetical protein
MEKSKQKDLQREESTKFGSCEILRANYLLNVTPERSRQSHLISSWSRIPTLQGLSEQEC